MIKVTIKSNEPDRVQYDIEMHNTANEPEVYSVVKVTWDGKPLIAVYVRRDGKKGHRWAELNAQKHRFQIARVLQVLDQNT
jgi:hypothetical protein